MTESHDPSPYTGGSRVSRRGFARASMGGLALGATTVTGLAFQKTPGNDVDPCTLTIAEGGRLLRAGALSSTRLTESCLARIKAFNPKINAYITVMGESALAQAAGLDAEAKAGRFRSPLHGIPIALKDNIDTAGTRTTGGSALFDDRLPETNAEVVRKLNQAGAVIIGKSNLQELAMGGSSASTYFLPVRNPWALDHIPAGSSGGSAAALIADMTVGALGTDTGGSVRMPAAYCSIVGLKPTYGLVSIRGIIPRTYSLDHCGPMTKTAADAAILLQVMAGYDKFDVASVEHASEDYLGALRQPLSGLRVGIPRAPFFDRLDSEVAAAVEDAITVLAKLTKGVKDVHLPSAGTFARTMLDGEIEAFHWEWFKRDAGRYSLSQRRTLEAVQKNLNDTATEACSAKVVDYVLANWELIRPRKTIDDAFQDFDVVALPTMRVLPMTINEALSREEDPKAREPEESSNCGYFNTFGLPAVSIPCGFSKGGLPIGLMLAGPRFCEGRILALAHAYEKNTEWHARRPALSPEMAVPPVNRKT